MAKWNKPGRKPKNEASEPVQERYGPEIKIYLAHGKVETISQVPPSPTDPPRPNTHGYDPTPRWKKRIEITGFVVILIYTVFTGLMWFANKKSADAAQSAANTATETLHVSQRAYISSGTPQIDISMKGMTIPFINSGHIPSGPIDIVLYDVIYSWTSPENSGSTNPVHQGTPHRSKKHFASIANGLPLAILAPIRDFSEDKLKNGLQGIKVVGIATYDDGFHNTPKQHSLFCEHTVYRMIEKQTLIEPCDPSVELPQLESLDWGDQKHQQ